MATTTNEHYKNEKYCIKLQILIISIDEDIKRLQKHTHNINSRSLAKLQFFDALTKLASSLFCNIIDNIRQNHS